MPKNNRKKHAGDEVEGGLGCTEAGCSKRYNHVSSWGRHLAADHGFTPAQSLGMVVAVRRDVLGPLGERFDTPRLCPVCKTAFSVKEGLMGHLRDKHGKTDEEVNQALLCETVTSDRYHTPVSCPRCDGAKTWPRKSHLAKHLLKMHGMTSEHAQLVAADPTLDGAAGSQSVAMGASAAMNHSTDIPSVAEDMDAEMNYSADSQSVAEDIDAEMNHSADSQSVAEDIDAEMNHSADSQSVAEDMDGAMNHSTDSQSVAEDMVADMDEVDGVDEPNEIIYLNKTNIMCLLCPSGSTTRVRQLKSRNTLLHLINVHGKSESEATGIIARLKSVPVVSADMPSESAALPGIDSGSLNVSSVNVSAENVSAENVSAENVSAVNVSAVNVSAVNVSAAPDMDDDDVDVAAVSGPNLNAKVNKKKRARQPTAGAMPTVPCPLCKVELKSKFVVKRHMKLKHKLSKEAIDQYQIATTTRRCEHCGRNLKNVYAHDCKQKPKEVVPQRVAEGCEPGGKRFHPGFAKFLQSQVAATTARQYVGKGRDLGKFWEDTIDYFRIDQLMEPLHHNVLFPSLASYLNQSETVGDGNVAIKTYKYLVDYSIEVFNIRYTADPNFEMNAKNDWKRNTKSNKDDYDRRHKGLINAAKQQTAENAAAAQEKGVLEFNPVRLAAVTIHILQHELVKVMLTDLANDNEEDLKMKYTESELRYCLMGQLVASTGKRSDAIANMKVGALQRAKVTPNGCWVVTVKEHKTFVAYGPSLVTFMTELLFQATTGYMHAYRDPSMEDEYLFANLNKKPTQMRQSIQWMKEKLIEGFCTEEEVRSLSAKAFRKAFSNWGRDHHDMDVRENVCEVQDHSQSVMQTNYAVASCEKASYVTKAIIDLIGSQAYRNRSTEQPGGDAVAVADAVVDPVADAIADAFGVDDAVAVAEQPGGEVVASTSGARTLAPPEKRSGRRGPAFSDAEREVLKTAFFVNGKQPTGITNAAVDLAKKNYPEFAALYDKIYKDKNKNPREVIMTIRKSIIKKKK